MPAVFLRATTLLLFLFSSFQAHASSRIVGGMDAQQAYPFIVSLQAKSSNGAYEHICGGSLIQSKWILTAAHCIDGVSPSALRVLAGMANLQDRGYIVNVKNIYTPQDTQAGLRDIALLELSGIVIQPTLKLAAPGTLSQLEPETVARAIGWGVLEEGSITPSNVLQEVDLPIQSQAQCLGAYPESEDLMAGFSFCAGYPDGGYDTCQGDSGGPLLLQQNDGSFVQLGIVSYGEGCARPNTYGVYTSIEAHLEWIQSYTQGVFFEKDLDFGVVTAGVAHRLMGTLRNYSGRNLYLTGLSVGGANANAFSTQTNYCRVLVRNGSCSFTLTVQMDQPGVYSAELYPQFDDASITTQTGYVSVEVSGETTTQPPITTKPPVTTNPPVTVKPPVITNPVITNPIANNPNINNPNINKPISNNPLINIMFGLVQSVSQLLLSPWIDNNFFDQFPLTGNNKHQEEKQK